MDAVITATPIDMRGTLADMAEKYSGTIQHAYQVGGTLTPAFVQRETGPATVPFIRPTRPFYATYRHDGSTWSATIRAYDADDAEARCKALNLTLDGEPG